MKVTVIETFQDVVTKAHHYPGDVIEVTDSKRIDAMVNGKLVEVAEPKTTKKANHKLEK